MCYRMDIILGKVFQPFENVKTILNSWAVQKQVARQLWPRAVVCPPVCEGREVRDRAEEQALRCAHSDSVAVGTGCEAGSPTSP